MKKEEAEKKEIKKALKVSVHEGCATSVSSGIGDTLISPLAVKFTDSAINIGLLSSFSGLASPLAQLYGSKLMEKFHRKNIVLFFVMLQALTWLPIGLIALLFWKGIIVSSSIYLLIIFYTLLAVLGGLAHPSWFSWMGDIVPNKERGKYFSKRNLITGIVSLFATLGAAFFIRSFTLNNKLLGFALLFFIAFVARTVAFIKFKQQYIPHFRPESSYHVSLKKLKKENKNFKKFAHYQMYFNFAIMIASPFFVMYMQLPSSQGGLGLNTFTYLLVTTSSTVFYLIFMPYAGKFSDKFGNLSLMYVANIFFVLSPLLWILDKTPAYLILVPQLVVGAANAALVISFSNFTYDSLEEEKRGVGVAYANVLVGIGVFIGSLVGGLTLNYIPINFMNRFIFIFIIAAAARLIVAIYFMSQLKEEKKVVRFPPMHIHVGHPFKTLHHEMGILINYSERKISEGLKYTEGLKRWGLFESHAIRK